MKVQLLQEKKTETEKKASGGWGFFGGPAVSQADIERLESQLKLMEEELEAKIQENQMVHMRIFDMKNEFQQKTKEWEDIIDQQKDQLSQLDDKIKQKDEVNTQLDSFLKEEQGKNC
mmetsp:Transcript_2097/g.1513  ORF Transcript_2097/g.1513 Transcript_2097/m.1513 type:complete len:117 (-) Transcript_2097:37-387(-)